MSKTVTDTHEFSISIIQHGDAAISNPTIPAEVESGEDFVIEYDVTNNGVTDTLYGAIKLADGTILAGSDWGESIPESEIVHKTFTHPGITAPMMGNIIEVGHL